jgi:beta-galactosidase/beta-glucuronidase
MKKTLVALLVLFNYTHQLSAQQTLPKTMLTQWSAKVDKVMPLNDYPRPNMVRQGWQNLNGQWDYAILPKQQQATKWDGKILVPFAVESYLSGVQRTMGKDSALWYKRTFKVKKSKPGDRVLLHFGAVDWQAEVYLNGKKIGAHQGGYTSFTIDATANITGKQEELIVRVWDPTDDGKQARGKQVKNPGGIYYTPVTGIWQTVWLEVVPESYTASYKITTDIDKSTLSITPQIAGAKPGDQLSITIKDGDKQITVKQLAVSGAIVIDVPQAKLWSPESPDLYTFELSVNRNGKAVDKVSGYFGMRKIVVAKDAQGVDRLYLNNKEVFQYGPLDQGYWPDGIYTAANEEALVSDIKLMKDAGFNMVRKHVKVEPLRWYYQCDKLGLIVWQDMPSGYGEIVPVKDHDHSVEGDWMAKNYRDIDRDANNEAMYRNEWKDIVEQLYNFPSICLWVPFNESWGQFKTNEILKWTKELDPTRVVDGPSGWIDRGEGETHDYHLYGDRLKTLPVEKGRALVIGEFGGLGFAIPGHVYSDKAWSYKSIKNEDEFYTAYKELIDKVAELKKQGFSAAVYTQLTDVETEINGLVTYDREKIKTSLDKLKKLHDELINGNNNQ